MTSLRLPENLVGAVAVSRSQLEMEHSLEATLADVALGIPHSKVKLDAIVDYLEKARFPGGPHDLAVSLVAGAEADNPDVFFLYELAWQQVAAIESLKQTLDALEAVIDADTAELERLVPGAPSTDRIA